MADAHTPVTNVATLVYTPASGGTPAVVLTNEGGVTAAIGQAGVTYALGFLLPPGQRINIAAARFPLYAITNAANTATTIRAEPATL